jgi:ribosomal protein S18 acetylase RimI-like enzyme
MRPATPADVPAIRTLLAHAYASDPLMTWIFPDDAHRREAIAAWLGTMVERYLTAGRVVVTAGDAEGAVADRADGGGVTGVAIWRWPDGSVMPGSNSQSSPSPVAPSMLPTLPTPSGIIAALIGAERARELGAAMNDAASRRPTEPHVYLNFLAVAAERQRTGIGRRLVEAGMAQAADAGHRVVLDTTNPDNHAFYQALGFEFTGSARLGTDGPYMWTMAAG